MDPYKFNTFKKLRFRRFFRTQNTVSLLQVQELSFYTSRWTCGMEYKDLGKMLHYTAEILERVHIHQLYSTF